MPRDPKMSRPPSSLRRGPSVGSRSKAARHSRALTGAALAFLVIVTLATCATMSDMAGSAKSTVHGWIKPEEIPRAHLDRQKTVFIALPADAETFTDRYVGSGQSVARAVAEAFARQGIPAQVAKNRMTNDEALSFAARTGSGYVVFPAITRWEQCNTWLGRPSRLALHVSVMDTASGKVVMAEPVKSVSFEPVSFTVESPEELLERPLSRYVSSLY
jgi:hypothetical protein